MNDRRHKLTLEVQSLICGLIRAGAFPHVAAEAAGIPQRVFERWMRCGKVRQPVEEYRLFAAAVMTAKAHARALAETDVRKRYPVSWLRSGPGREGDGKPGWTGTVQPVPLKGPDDTMGSSERWWAVFPPLLDALAPFPEARAAAAAVLARAGVRKAIQIVEEAATLPTVDETALARVVENVDAEPSAVGDGETRTVVEGTANV